MLVKPSLGKPVFGKCKSVKIVQRHANQGTECWIDDCRRPRYVPRPNICKQKSRRGDSGHRDGAVEEIRSGMSDSKRSKAGVRLIGCEQRDDSQKRPKAEE